MLKLADMGLATNPGVPVKVDGCAAQRVGDALNLTVSLAPLAPAVIEIGAE